VKGHACDADPDSDDSDDSDDKPAAPAAQPAPGKTLKPAPIQAPK